MSNIPENCWEWDGFLGECVKYHPVQWWQYTNVFSIATVAVLVAVLTVIVLIIFAKVMK